MYTGEIHSLVIMILPELRNLVSMITAQSQHSLHKNLIHFIIRMSGRRTHLFWIVPGPDQWNGQTLSMKLVSVIATRNGSYHPLTTLECPGRKWMKYFSFVSHKHINYHSTFFFMIQEKYFHQKYFVINIFWQLCVSWNALNFCKNISPASFNTTMIIIHDTGTGISYARVKKCWHWVLTEIIMKWQELVKTVKNSGASQVIRSWI